MRKPSKVFPHQDIWLCAAFNHIWMNSFYRGRFSNLEKVRISKDKGINQLAVYRHFETWIINPFAIFPKFIAWLNVFSHTGLVGVQLGSTYLHSATLPESSSIISQRRTCWNWTKHAANISAVESSTLTECLAGSNVPLSLSSFTSQPCLVCIPYYGY